MKDVEDLLREGMERFTSDLRAPAGLARLATRRRRRRLALRSVAGVATALAAAAVALVAVEVPGAGSGGPAVASASVVKRVDNALNAAEPGDIAQMTVTTRGVPAFGGPAVATTAEEWSYRDQWRSVTDSSAGHPLYDEGFAGSLYTLVSYQTQTWAREPGLGRAVAGLSSPARCGLVPVPGRAAPQLFQPGLPGMGFSASSPPATAARSLRAAVACGNLVVAGHQRVDGREAIELTSPLNGPVSETIWVSPGTYLPVRVVVRSAAGQPVFRLTADITWLAPTARNLAELTVPIPAGFRHVQLMAVVLPIVQQFPGKQKPKTICLPVPAGSTCQRVSSSYGGGLVPEPQP
jgi:hypothetical protein